MQHFFISFAASFILVVRNSFRLIAEPYQAMRAISEEKDYIQVGIILIVASLYFVFAAGIRDSDVYPQMMAFLSMFLLSIGLLYALGTFLRVKNPRFLDSLIHLSAYSLLPAFFWFVITSVLFVLLPPPRQQSLLGSLFSLVYIGFSITLLFWRIVMLYLTIRFSFKIPFKKVVAVMIAFASWLLPYTVVLYYFRLMRVPYI